MLEDLTRDLFAENLNTTFAVHYGGPEAIAMELVEVSELRAVGRQRIYTLLFRGPLEIQLPQRIYRMEHPRLGEFELFIVPVAREHDGMRYEAVFNQLVKE
ncbi:MAG TPA: hypothetical protein VMB78_11915 [Dissulfurispiraceae bacterium]|nr:hypothetical protein [Dissulfurispiraceae bacterium]